MNRMDTVCNWFGLHLFEKFNLVENSPCAWRKIHNPYYFTDEGLVSNCFVLDNIHLADIICGTLKVEKIKTN